MIIGNSGDDGGGLSGGPGCTLSMSDSLIAGNDSRGSGGINFGGPTTLTECSISGNSGDGGGGIVGAGLTLMNCTFSGNVATGDGNGGALVITGGSNSITNCTFIDNSCQRNGGAAIAVEGGGTLSTTITGCAFTGNVAGPYGAGGALSISAGGASLIDCTITGNTATNGGAISTSAGLYTVGYTSTVTPGALEIDGCLISGNSAEVYGGGILNDGGMALSDCTISGNAARSGGGIADMAKLSGFHSLWLPGHSHPRRLHAGGELRRGLRRRHPEREHNRAADLDRLHRLGELGQPGRRPR